MAHLFRQLYVDEIDFEGITQDKLIDLILTEFLHRQIHELEELMHCSSELDPWSVRQDCCEMMTDDDLWLTNTDQAISMIDCDDVWHSIVEAYKILKYPKPSSEQKKYLESLYEMNWHMLKTIYYEFERTLSFKYLMDYTSCTCKLKYQSTV